MFKSTGQRVLWALLLLLIIAVVVWAVRSRTPAPGPECTPEGGLACVDGAIHVCQSGKAISAGSCPGGCTDEDGVARCLDTNGTLLAPEGTGCQPGMALCEVGAKRLLVCRDGALAAGAECPGGCFEASEGGGLYCLNETESIRFAVGFPCPRFPGVKSPYVCGPDSASLLVCKDGVLEAHPVSCPVCAQRRSGVLACRTEAGDVIDPETGEHSAPREGTVAN